MSIALQCSIFVVILIVYVKYVVLPQIDKDEETEKYYEDSY